MVLKYAFLILVRKVKRTYRNRDVILRKGGNLLRIIKRQFLERHEERELGEMDTHKILEVRGKLLIYLACLCE